MLGLGGDDELTTVRLWSLTSDALVEHGPEAGSMTIVTRWGEVALSGVEPPAAEALRRMAFGPVALRNVLTRPGHASGHPSPGDVRAVERVLERLRGVVVHSLGLPTGGAPGVSIVPLVCDPPFRPVAPPAGRLLRLSRFATLRATGGVLTLDAPSAPFRAVLGQPSARAVATALCVPSTAGEVAVATGLPQPVVDDLLSFLVAAGTVLVADPDATFAEDHDPDLGGWSHHELTFHVRSRNRQRDRLPSGAVEEQVTTPPPVTAPPRPGRTFPLHRPDLAALTTDPPLTSLLERDHACPKVSGAAFRAEELGELLYRGARVRSLVPAAIPMAGDVGFGASQRPYVNLACLYELELYLTVNRCVGLPRAIYHYAAGEHALTLIDDDPRHVDALLDTGRVGAATTATPAAVLSVTARMERSAWLLRGASYATALMHTGALQETIYLVAHAMGISAHPIAADGGDLTEHLLNLDAFAEVGVGECVLDPVL